MVAFDAGAEIEHVAVLGDVDEEVHVCEIDGLGWWVGGICSVGAWGTSSWRRSIRGCVQGMWCGKGLGYLTMLSEVDNVLARRVKI